MHGFYQRAWLGSDQHAVCAYQGRDKSSIYAQGRLKSAFSPREGVTDVGPCLILPMLFLRCLPTGATYKDVVKTTILLSDMGDFAKV